MSVLKTSIACILVLLTGSLPPVIAASFEEVVAFGDSLTDNGNLFEVDLSLVPDPAFYYQGRFSNGPVWIEYLTNADRLDSDLDDRALGGAESQGHAPPGLQDQVQFYTSTHSDPSADTLFAIWIGANDFLNAERNYQDVVDNIEDAMEMLADFGAEALLVLNLPDLGATPDNLGTEEAPEATLFSQNFNADLAAMVAEFRVRYPRIAVYTYDTYQLFDDIRRAPAAYGFINSSQVSPNFSVPDNFDGAGYVFWDDLHPTTQAHAVVADGVFTLLAAQPDPEGGNDSDEDDDDDSTLACFVSTLLRSADAAGPKPGIQRLPPGREYRRAVDAVIQFAMRRMKNH